MNRDILFEPIRFRNLEVRNRLFRSSISGRIDNYDGSGTRARINFERRFARGGVGAIISSHVPVHISGRILPNYATIDRDDRIDFWHDVVEAVHAESCKYILQLSMSGRQQDLPGSRISIRKRRQGVSTVGRSARLTAGTAFMA